MNIRAKVFGSSNAPEEPILKAKKPKGAKAEDLHSIAVPRGETRTSNTRHDDRHRLVEERVRVSHNGRDFDVELVNLSGGGAMVSGDFGAKLWDKVTLHLGDDGTIDCAVRWIRDDRAGLEFAHETRIDCGADEQAEVLREVVRRSFPDLEFNGTEPAPEQHDGDEVRTEKRHPLVWSGLLHHDYQSTPVRLRNISSTGVMIECSAALRIDSEPLLELGDALSVSTTVAWTVGDHAGLRFHAPFDLYDLARSRPQVTSADWEPPSYLANDATTDSPWKESRMSLGTLRQDLEGFLKR
jgi:hypothetical protein